MASTSAAQHPIQSSNKASRRRSTTMQTNKHREDIALTNYMSPKKGSSKQVDPMHATAGYPFIAPHSTDGGAYSTSAEWTAYYQEYHQAMQQQQQQQNGAYYYVPSYHHPYYQQPYHPNNNSTWADQSQPLKPQRTSSTPVPRPSASPRLSSRLGSKISNSPRNNPLSMNYSQQPCYYHHRPSRTSSSSSSIVSATSSSDFSTDRRSSVTSMASSVVSDVSSVSSKRSISRRLRDVFKITPPPSPSTIKTTNGGVEQEQEQAQAQAQAQEQQCGPRRRSSIRALSNLFHKNNIVHTVLNEETEEDTAAAGVKAEGKQGQASSVASSSATSRKAAVDRDEDQRRATVTTGKRTTKRIQFYPTIQVHETFSSGEYDRRCDTEATCQKLTPLMGIKIKQELNEYKLTDMQVHAESRRYTHFLL